jgi:hypothetical protein
MKCPFCQDGIGEFTEKEEGNHKYSKYTCQKCGRGFQPEPIQVRYFSCSLCRREGNSSTDCEVKVRVYRKFDYGCFDPYNSCHEEGCFAEWIFLREEKLCPFCEKPLVPNAALDLWDLKNSGNITCLSCNYITEG